MDIKDSVVVITGGAAGIGRALAVHLSKKGAKIALADMNQEKLEEAKGLLETECRTYICNVSEEDQVVKLFEDVVNDFGTVDVSIANAGITRDGMFVRKKGDQIQKMSLDKFNQVISVNLTGVWLTGREAAASFMKLDKPGVIISLSSLSRAGNMGQNNYSAAKAGVDAMTVTWAKELSRAKIRTAAIAPGYTGTEMVMAIDQAVLDKIAATIPLGRLGTPDEMAQTAAFIIENDYVTGRVFEIDGGLRM
ncbi:MAG: SDR family oxidoreductase [SAR324 cluster bacterium]|nr:SDR family oxidoreductase [SAR324 cluster bacterium]